MDQISNFDHNKNVITYFYQTKTTALRQHIHFHCTIKIFLYSCVISFFSTYCCRFVPSFVKPPNKVFGSYVWLTQSSVFSQQFPFLCFCRLLNLLQNENGLKSFSILEDKTRNVTNTFNTNRQILSLTILSFFYTKPRCYRPKSTNSHDASQELANWFASHIPAMKDAHVTLVDTISWL